jgi:hypothetical protein
VYAKKQQTRGLENGRKRNRMIERRGSGYLTMEPTIPRELNIVSFVP